MNYLGYRTSYPNIVKNTNCSDSAVQGIQALMIQIFFSFTVLYTDQSIAVETENVFSAYFPFLSHPSPFPTDFY